MKTAILSTLFATVAGVALAGGHAMAPAVDASDQDVSGGTVTAETVVAPANGWLVVHRTGADMAPGPVVGYAPLKEGGNDAVTAILQEDVAPGDMLMLMVHGEDGGMVTGGFEYSLGASEDGPIRVDGDLVMTVVTAQ
mgnify:CR=1 FL=1